MAAGFTYNLTPEDVKEERYDVETGRRRRGPYKLDTTGLPIGEYLPSFTPIAADLKKKTATVCVRAKVVEAYTDGAEALTIKVAKGSLLASGMYIGNGSKGAQVSSIDKTNASYDTVTIAAQFGANLSVGDVLFEATAVGGTTPKAVANSALYERAKIESGIVLVALLMRAFEIEPDKLAMPFSDIDKANMPHFQFNAPDVKAQGGTVYTDATQSASGLMSAADKKKLDGISEQANKYTLPAASKSAVGGVKQGTAVADAAGGDEKDKINALLASLRTAGIIANS